MVHRVKFDDQKDPLPKKSEEQKAVGGSQATDKSSNAKANKAFSQLKPESIHSLFLRGCALLELKRYSETRKAITDFTQCIEFLTPGTPSSFVCELFYKRGLAYQNIGKSYDAIKDYTESMNRSRSSDQQGKLLFLKCLVGRGQIYQAMYNLGLAFTDIDEANKMTGNTDPYYLCCRASVYATKHDDKRAMVDLDKASKMGCDEHLDALIQRASVLSELGKHDVALPDLEKALILSHENTQKADIYYQRGICEYALKNKDQALSSYEQSIKMNPYHARAHFRIGMIQVERGHFKEASRTLSRAHELAPHRRDISLELAIVNSKLGNVDNTDDHDNHGIQHGSSSLSTASLLDGHIQKLREEIKSNSSSTRSHLELGMIYDGLLTQEQDATAQKENYKEAVSEYHAAIETDSKNMYPQARALLAICQNKMNDIIEAHNWHLEFYDILFEHKNAVQHWKAYMKDVHEKMESGELEPHLDEDTVRKLMRMERNRKTRNIDEENYRNDAEDQHKNQFTFYTRLRDDLSDVLGAIGLANLDNSIIAHNLRDKPTRISNILELLSANSGFVPEIETILSGDIKASTKVFQKRDFAIIKHKLKLIEHVGDMTDQVEIAQLVARHMCTRYRSQLICLKSDIHGKTHSFKAVDEVKPSKSFWSCCSTSTQIPTKQSTTSNWNASTEHIATFAVAFIIHAINNETIRSSTSESLSRREALASMLVLIICRAHKTTATSFYQSINFNEKNNLPIDQHSVLKILEKTKKPVSEGASSPIEWDLYEFFRAPGIYYYFDDASEQIYYYKSGPSMEPHIYGYRLGTEEEISIFEHN